MSKKDEDSKDKGLREVFDSVKTVFPMAVSCRIAGDGNVKEICYRIQLPRGVKAKDVLIDGRESPGFLTLTVEQNPIDAEMDIELVSGRYYYNSIVPVIQMRLPVPGYIPGKKITCRLDPETGILPILVPVDFNPEAIPIAKGLGNLGIRPENPSLN